MDIHTLRALTAEERYHVDSVESIVAEITDFLEYTRPDNVKSGRFVNFVLNKENKLRILRGLSRLKSDNNKSEPLLGMIADYLEVAFNVQIGAYGESELSDTYDPLDSITNNLKDIVSCLYDLEEYIDDFRDISQLKPYMLGPNHVEYIRGRLQGIVDLLSNIQSSARVIYIEG